MRFEKGFLVGAATAVHQVEGNNIHSDFWAMEQLEHSNFTEPSLDAVDHYNRYEEDIKLLAGAGLNAYRFSIEWARIEPEKGRYDDTEIEHYRRVLQCCYDNNVIPVVTKQNAMGGMSNTMFNMITSMVGTGMNKGANGKKADAITSPVLDALDIAGYNYASGRYPLEGKAHPERVVFGSETFPQDIWKNWQMVKQYPYLVGDFMWTAWDYLGEAGIGAWAYTADGKSFDKPYPWLLADVGAMDLLGDPNGELFWAQAAWGLLDKPAIAVQPVNHPTVKPAKSVWRGTNALPSWSWQGCEGNRAVVEVYTDAAAVELLLNGKSLGKQKTKDGRAIFKTKYASGTLEAIARNSAGRELSRSALRSASGPVRICVEPEEQAVQAGDIVYVPVSLKVENGEVEHNADRKLTVNVEGGELLAFGSANPRTEERFDAANYTTYYGRALAVVRSDKAGRITVSVTDGKQTGTAEITVKGE